MTEDEQLRKILESLARIEKKIDSLPCQRGFCPVEEE